MAADQTVRMNQPFDVARDEARNQRRAAERETQRLRVLRDDLRRRLLEVRELLDPLPQRGGESGGADTDPGARMEA